MTRPPALIALTGGSGFIGTHFAAAARARGYRIRQLTRHMRSAFDADDEVCPFDMDLADIEPGHLSGCVALVHLAAHIPRNHADPAEAERCWKVNAMGTLHLVRAAASVGIGHVVQTSSANAYAPSMSAPDESAPLFPPSRSYYLGSKILQEIYATEICGASAMTLATLRLGSVYGAGQSAGAIATMARAATEGCPIPVSDGGRFGADMVHVNDVTRALMLCLERCYSGPLNVGSGVRATIKTIAVLLAALTDGQIVEHPASTLDVDEGFPALDIARLRALGQHPTPLAEGLATMVRAPWEVLSVQ